MTCECRVTLEVLMGPHTGMIIGYVLTDIHIGIGRSKKFVGDSGLLLSADFDVSSKHATIFFDQQTSQIVIQDVGSTNGTKLSDTLIAKQVNIPLRDGETITVGSSLIAFRIETQCTCCKEKELMKQSPIHEPIVQQVDVPRAPDMEECLVCHCSLFGLSFEERHIHVNQCLDTQPKAKKAKKTKSIENQQLDLAKALSKSLVSDEIEASVSKSMLKSELASIDAQILSLQKKRAKIIKQLEKSTKQYKKAAKSRVLPPSDVLSQLHNNTSAWEHLYPLSTALSSVQKESNSIFINPTGNFLWQKAAQGSEWTTNDFLVPNLLTCEPRDEVPEYVILTFPQWKDNLAFIKSQTDVNDVQNALKSLQETKNETVQALNQEDSSELDAKAQALAFFETLMVNRINELLYSPDKVKEITLEPVIDQVISPE
ncbi:hypothetical protein THRCLA_04405 [Thraustotheca clavata]|uniref:FHA domain-containing protein n=1 Tax=Thraustotheca clavata TaxID=74557 RepID=A0A1V9ZZV4_9STRA|nr:hypothetical protein THRCLA_04405 [Thraustotheca clavata]